MTKPNETTGADSASALTNGLCGCGRAGRYFVMRNGEQIMACNKYMRCLTYEEQGEALKQANMRLLNLMALIHRDGGHHVQAVGLEQALVDAEQVLYKWRGAYDVLRSGEQSREGSKGSAGKRCNGDRDWRG